MCSFRGWLRLGSLASRQLIGRNKGSGCGGGLPSGLVQVGPREVCIREVRIEEACALAVTVDELGITDCRLLEGHTNDALSRVVRPRDIYTTSDVLRRSTVFACGRGTTSHDL